MALQQQQQQYDGQQSLNNKNKLRSAKHFDESESRNVFARMKKC